MSDRQTRPPADGRADALACAFALVVGLGAFLLFEVQLVLGKRLLPWFGGTSAVWTTCMLFFQTALVVGYAWAHLLAGRLPPRRQRDLHLLLLTAALVLLARRALQWPSPILPGSAEGWLPAGAPVVSILGLLASAVGLPFLVLAATSPLLQAWLALVRPGASPFWLFALSNAGSLLGLVAYPLLVEPLAPLRLQGWLWSAGFAVYSAGLVACAVVAGRARTPRALSVSGDVPPAPGVATRLLWLALAAFPSVLLLAVTSHLTQEVAAVPLLWMLPLALYLLSFTLCFGWPGLASRTVWGPALAAAGALAAFALPRGADLRVPGQVGLWAAVLFVYAMAGHGELVRLRPDPRHLTSYYLTIAVGGALGGACDALAAPVLFRGYWELHLGLVAGAAVVVVAMLAAPASPLRAGPPGRVFALRVSAASGLVALAVALAAQVSGDERGVVLARRGFYGVLRVVREGAGGPDEGLELLHGRIAHGLQLVRPGRRQEITTYFGPSSGVGLAIRRHPKRLAGEPLRVGVVGLGAGTLAAWSEPGDTFRFYELDPEVARLSQGDAPVFTFLGGARGTVGVALGDGRLALEREPPQRFDVLVLDAFSGDAIPVHLLTREAFEVWLRHLAGDGTLAVQITNRYVDLRPVVRGVAAERGLAALHIPSSERGGVLWGSDWMLLSPDPSRLRDEAIEAASLPELGKPERIVWTDEWSDLLRVLKR